MNKKFLSLMATSCLAFSLAGCNPGDTDKSSSTAEGDGNFKEAPYTLNVSYPLYGDVPSDLPMIQEKMNEITLKEINVKVEFKPVSVTNMANTYTLAASSGEKLDLIMLLPGSGYLGEYSGNNMIKPIDAEMDKYGKDIKNGLGNLLKVAEVNGKQYGVPGIGVASAGGGIWLNENIVKKYNIDINQIKTMDDLDPIFEKVHASEPDMKMIAPIGVSSFLLNYDTLGNGLGVLRNGGVDNLKVVNIYETKEYEQAVKKVREWYQKDYISKDFATTQATPNDLLDSGKVFSIPMTTDFSKKTLGDPLPKNQVNFVEPTQKTGDLQTFIWAVPSSAERPDKSVQLLNLVYENQSLANLLSFGIEGEHYVKNSDGTIDTSMTNPKKFALYWPLWGDANKYPIVKQFAVGVGGDVEKYKSSLDEWKKSTKDSKALGFMFDTSPVKTEIASCSAVIDQYIKLLEGGALEPEKYLKTLNEKLYDAGLQKIIDEKQRQLDEWAKAQK
ncbi:MAG: ABC transporter substrate-binding protein [Neobacillus sp.]